MCVFLNKNERQMILNTHLSTSNSANKTAHHELFISLLLPFSSTETLQFSGLQVLS